MDRTGRPSQRECRSNICGLLHSSKSKPYWNCASLWTPHSGAHCQKQMEFFRPKSQGTNKTFGHGFMQQCQLFFLAFFDFFFFFFCYFRHSMKEMDLNNLLTNTGSSWYPARKDLGEGKVGPNCCGDCKARVATKLGQFVRSLAANARCWGDFFFSFFLFFLSFFSFPSVWNIPPSFFSFFFFFKLLMQTCQPTQAEISLIILRSLTEDLFIYQEEISEKRRTDLLTGIVSSLCNPFFSSRKPMKNKNHEECLGRRLDVPILRIRCEPDESSQKFTGFCSSPIQKNKEKILPPTFSFLSFLFSLFSFLFFSFLFFSFLFFLCKAIFTPIQSPWKVGQFYLEHTHGLFGLDSSGRCQR